MVSVTKQSMVLTIQNFLREHGYAVRQKAISVAFLGPAYSFFSRKLYGIYCRLAQNRPEKTVADLAEYGVAARPRFKPEMASATAQPETAEVLDHVPPRRLPPQTGHSPNKLPLNSSVKIPPSARVEFLKRSHRFRACTCGYLDPDRQASVCPNCNRPKAGVGTADEVA